jgi:hypothetical protein
VYGEDGNVVEFPPGYEPELWWSISKESSPGRGITRGQAIEIARKYVLAQDWPWLQPVNATRLRRWVLFGPRVWWVITNGSVRGGNCTVTVDEKTGRVLAGRYKSY